MPKVKQAKSKRSRMQTEKEEPPKKELMIQFRVDASQYDALAKLARRGGETLGSWCRRLLLERAGYDPDQAAPN